VFRPIEGVDLKFGTATGGGVFRRDWVGGEREVYKNTRLPNGMPCPVS